MWWYIFFKLSVNATILRNVIAAVFNNMRTLEFKPKPMITFLAAVSHLSTANAQISAPLQISAPSLPREKRSSVLGTI